MIYLVDIMSDGNTNRMNVGLRRMYDEGDEEQPFIFDDASYNGFYYPRRPSVLGDPYIKVINLDGERAA